MADSLNETAGPEVRPAGPAPSATPAQPSRARVLFRGRFAIAYLALALVLGAAAGLLVVFVANDGTETVSGGEASSWSEWRPASSGTLAVREIAREVAPHYRLRNGKQLVAVIAEPMIIRPSPDSVIPVTALVIDSGRAGVRRQRFDIAVPEAGVFYQMCGDSQACLIPDDGSTADQRGTLVGREALELALYTFHYLPETDHVLAFLPPPPGVQPTEPEFSRVIWLPETKLAPLLRVPLSSALPPGSITLKPGDLSPAQSDVIERFVRPQIYVYRYQQIADQSVIMQLSPIEGLRP